MMKPSPGKPAWRHGRTLTKICLVFAFLAASVRGHYGRARSLMFPRRAYNYHQRSPRVDLMSDVFSLPVYFNSLFRQQQEQLSHSAQSDPAFHVQELESGEIQLNVDLPGVAATDFKVELLEDGTLLHISGSRRYRDSVAEFDQLFRLDKDVDGDNVRVTLSDGVLRVTAPRKEKVIKILPIVVEEKVETDVLNVDAQVVSDTESNEAADEEVDGMTITTEDEQ